MFDRRAQHLCANAAGTADNLDTPLLFRKHMAKHAFNIRQIQLADDLN